jgi:hypothetical protein
MQLSIAFGSTYQSQIKDEQVMSSRACCYPNKSTVALESTILPLKLIDTGRLLFDTRQITSYPSGCAQRESVQIRGCLRLVLSTFIRRHSTACLVIFEQIKCVILRTCKDISRAQQSAVKTAGVLLLYDLPFIDIILSYICLVTSSSRRTSVIRSVTRSTIYIT